MHATRFFQGDRREWAKFEGDRKPFDQLRSILVAFTPDFEILPGTAPKTAAKGLKPFEIPDLAQPDMAGD